MAVARRVAPNRAALSFLTTPRENVVLTRPDPGVRGGGTCALSVTKCPSDTPHPTGEWFQDIRPENGSKVIRRLRLPAAGLLLAGLIAGCSTASANVVVARVTAHSNLTYCNSQTLDLYIPHAAATRPLPLAIYVHGGGMTSGDKSDLTAGWMTPVSSTHWPQLVMRSRA